MLRIIAHRLIQSCVPDLQRSGCYLVKKSPVMRYGDDRPVICGKVFFQPFRGQNIQMVGRLIQNQQIRLRKKQPRQMRFPYFPSAEAPVRPFQFFRLETESHQSGSRSAPERKAAFRFVSFAQVAHAPYQPVAVLRFRFQSLFQDGNVMFHTEEIVPCMQCDLVKGTVKIRLRHLGDRLGPAVSGYDDRSAVRFGLLIQNGQKRRLPAAVRSDQSDPVIFRHLEGYAFKQHVCTKRF